MFLTPAEADEIAAQVARIEARTGVQIVAAVVAKSDTYVELPWKAFALGVSLAAFAVVAVEAWRPDWVTANSALRHAVVLLGAGAAGALLAVFVPAFARLFLRSTRRDLEVRLHAQSLFLAREVFRAPRRAGVLVLVSLFERRIEILPDIGLRDRVSDAEWRGIISGMTTLLGQRRPFHAMQHALAALEGLLAAKGFQRTRESGNALPDRPIEEPAP